MLRIGEFSKLSRVSIRMLRHYDEIGLLKPVCIDPESGYRYYAEYQLASAGRITALKNMGFGLSSIAQILACDDREMLASHMLVRQAELEDQIHQLSQRLRLLDTALTRLRKDEIMKYDVTVKTFPERYAATVRMQIPSYEMEGMLWNMLVGETEPLNIVPDDPCYCCAVFHDKEFRESDVDVEVYKTVKGCYPDTAHVRFRMLEEVTVASAVCKGSYEQMGDLMAAVAQWVCDNGYEFAGPAFNIYHVSPYETDRPDEFVTEVCYPVKKV